VGLIRVTRKLEKSLPTFAKSSQNMPKYLQLDNLKVPRHPSLLLNSITNILHLSLFLSLYLSLSLSLCLALFLSLSLSLSLYVSLSLCLSLSMSRSLSLSLYVSISFSLSLYVTLYFSLSLSLSVSLSLCISLSISLTGEEGVGTLASISTPTCPHGTLSIPHSVSLSVRQHA
jgi:hypothetical protein